MKRRSAIVAVVACIAGLSLFALNAQAEAPGCQTSEAFCYESATTELIQSINKVTEPNIAVSSWLGASQ